MIQAWIDGIWDVVVDKCIVDVISYLLRERSLTDTEEVVQVLITIGIVVAPPVRITLEKFTNTRHRFECL